MKNVTPSFDLNNVRIASPCHEDWSKMKGDERMRHCASCKLNVFNVSEMSKADAETLILERGGKERVCMKLMRRHDGTIITKDCPVGVSRVRSLRMKVASLAFSLIAGVFASVGASNRAFGSRELKGRIALPIDSEPLMGEIAMPDEPTIEMGKPMMPQPSPSPTPHYEDDQPYRFDDSN